MTATYVPGTPAAFAGPTAVVMAPGDFAHQLVELARTAEPTALGVIHLLSGGDLTQLPDFACVVSTDDDLRAVVRGRFRIECGEWFLDGAGAATWSEHPIVRTVGEPITLRGLDVDEAAPQLPLQGGVVHAATIIWHPTRTASDSATPLLTDTPAPTTPALTAPALVSWVEDIPTVVPPPPAPTQVTPAQTQVAPPPTTPTTPAFDEFTGDHDGRTVTAAQLRALREKTPASPTPAPPTPPAAPARPRVVVQVAGHSDVLVERTLLIGRSPRATQTSSADLPALLVVDDLYVSGTHVEVTFEGANPMVIDRSRNGTLITRPGQAPVQLAKDVAVPLSDGAVLTLSDQVSARIMIGTP